MLTKDAIRHRVKRYGFTHYEAHHCPPGMPVWMWRIEQDEGLSVREIMEDTAKTARDTGYTLADLAREWEVKPCTLGYWSRKWGITWPVGVSERQKQAARDSMLVVRTWRKV